MHRLVATVVVLLALVTAILGAHVHDAGTDRPEPASCLDCGLRVDPTALAVQVELVEPTRLELAAPAVYAKSPRVHHCLDWAPKQGPPAA